jgi:signal transduction histidine kinase
LKIFRHKILWRLSLPLIAVIIGTGSLFYTEKLVDSLKTEERKKVELWAEATRLINSSDENQDLDFLFSIIENNKTVPVILTDSADNIITCGNISEKRKEDPLFLRMMLNKMKQKYDPIEIDLPDGSRNLIYYRDSVILTQLIYYPYVQLGIIILFILVSYLASSASRKAEQNQVWVGLSKETAHQLGTPTSSLAGWIEILQQIHPEIKITDELARDVARLEKVTERFSKIGSKPALTPENIPYLIDQTIEYLKTRTSSKIRFIHEPVNVKKLIIPVNRTLFEWVIENISKNAIDAMEGHGEIKYLTTETESHAIIDISDTGKGIPKSLYKKIFNPGFTTKQRGWGLGLSLARRIIEEYHHGRIFMRHSELGKGSSIRIILNKK